MKFKGNWDDHQPLIQFDYNNSYQTNIEMSPYEALYGRQCRTPVCWRDVGERKILGPKLMQAIVDKVKVIQERLKIAQNQQKSYADNRRMDFKFAVGDRVFL